MYIKLNKVFENDDPCWDDYEQIGMKDKNGKEVPNCVPKNETIQEYNLDESNLVDFIKELKKCKLSEHGKLTEAEYQGREVPLNKPMQGDVKKFKVYVKNDKGNVVKVNFGDPDMRIKKNDPEKKKSFRARHNCDNPGPKWKARYWSCKKWE